MDIVFTIGHASRSLGEFVNLVQSHLIGLIVDIRSIPRSRANPQFNQDTLPAALAAQGIGYRHLRALGGLRHRPKGSPPSSNLFWRNLSFRNYADYAGTEAFRRGLADLEDLARANRLAIMCAETLWWRCHRRIVADYLLWDGFEVRHILARQHVDQGSPTPGCQRQADGTLVYPATPDLRTDVSA